MSRSLERTVSSTKRTRKLVVEFADKTLGTEDLLASFPARDEGRLEFRLTVSNQDGRKYLHLRRWHFDPAIHKFVPGRGLCLTFDATAARLFRTCAQHVDLRLEKDAKVRSALTTLARVAKTSAAARKVR